MEGHRNVSAVESREQVLHRLAAIAQERQLSVVWYEVDGRPVYFVTSSSESGRIHRVTRISCSCVGFVHHGHCTHHAAFLAYLNELPPVDPADAVARRERQGEITAARAEVARLRRIAKSSADFYRLEEAKGRLAALVAAPLSTAVLELAA